MVSAPAPPLSVSLPAPPISVSLPTLPTDVLLGVLVAGERQAGRRLALRVSTSVPAASA